MFQEVNNIAQQVFIEYANRILNESRSEFQVAEWRNDGIVTVLEDGVTLSFSNEMMIFSEFGTGQFAASYLSNKPQDIKDEAMKFYKNGLGRTIAEPIIYPLIIRYSEEIPKEIDKRVEEWFKSVKF